MDIRILVLEAGFVQACYCPDPSGYPFWMPYRNARTIRRWGTANGLAELVNGPTKNTVLDDAAPAGQVPVRAIINAYNVTDAGRTAWAAVLGEPE